jgi:hypothetical protein
MAPNLNLPSPNQTIREAVGFSMDIDQQNVGKMLYEVGRINVGPARPEPSRSLIIPILIKRPDHRVPAVDPLSGGDLVVHYCPYRLNMSQSASAHPTRNLEDDGRHVPLCFTSSGRIAN